MVAQPDGLIVLPLHRFSPTSHLSDDCDYVVGKTQCHEPEASSVHAVARVSKMSGHAWRNLNPPGYAPGACTFTEGDEVCGRRKESKIHAGYAPQLTDEEAEREDEEEPTAHPDVLVHEFFKVGTSEAVVDEFLRRVLLKVREKDAMYGEAWRRRGWNGNLTRILTKADRLEHMLMRYDPMTADDTEETVLDTVEDMAALCAFFAVNFNDKNRFGGQR